VGPRRDDEEDLACPGRVEQREGLAQPLSDLPESLLRLALARAPECRLW